MKTSHRYIAIEGVIGVGKTSLARILSEKLNGRLILENHDENPFLAQFYKDPRHFAFQTQMFFLLSRFRQQQELPEPDFFHSTLISDYIFPKDRIFAYINLSENELNLYEKVMALMEMRVRKPDIVVYLQSSTERLMRNIRTRSRPYEREMSEEYIRTLNEGYNHYFFNYEETPLLIVNTTQLDFVNNADHLAAITAEIEREQLGTRYFNPVDI
ncbi:MAG: deoxynucleoside kinase [Calditrichaeota bacterium]|nr:deoxynucleoside kinase [Calditrichota bacterium]MCB9367914.1 deoxynucleoside kinase [Calditrichota bacterium]